MSRPAWTLLVVIALASGLISQASAATLTQGNISGEVVTSRGDALADAVLEVSNTNTGLTRTTTSNAIGLFRVPQLPPGQYSISATREGFEATRLTNVTVRHGTGTQLLIAMPQLDAMDTAIEEIVIVASRVAKIDFDSSETTLALTELQIDLLPVARDSTSVAMLAAGTVPGVVAFGGSINAKAYGTSPGHLASFGGSSVAENAYYINGMNVTNFRNGVGGSTVPFEFFQEFQVKTSGLSAEFGRATGGFINAITKSGSNDFEFGGGMFYEPSNLRAKTPNVIASDGSPVTLGPFESRTTSEAYLYASGPIIEDTLFFYGLYNPRDVESSGASNVYLNGDSTDAFWGGKLDYKINDNHMLEFTLFSDQFEYVETTFNFDVPSGTILDNRGDTFFGRGGQHWILKYTGNLTESLSISALTGHSEADLSAVSAGDEFPTIFDNRAPEFFTNLGSWVNFRVKKDADERDVYRVDFEWELGRHLVRAGIDRESNSSFSLGDFSGGDLWIYFDAAPGDSLPTGIVPPGATQVAQHDRESNGGSFDVETSSWYLEDSWQVADNLMLQIGVRNERYDNRNANGETFIKMSDQWAPRGGFSWDIFGDGSTKLYGSFGRYHLPVASNTNVSLGGRLLSSSEWFVLDGLNADDTPQLGTQIGRTVVFANGEIADPDSLIDKTIDPMYQDEYTLGFETAIGDQFVLGMNAIRRDLASTIEDVIIDSTLNDYAQRNGFTTFFANGFDYYILTNPGTDMLVRIDLDDDGVPESIPLTATELGFPVSERKYSAINLFVERLWDSDWFARIDYTWSKSYGNNEGSVRSDNGQNAAGLTTLFDLPGLMDGAYGDLPNDRRHSVKIYGAWQFQPEWTISANASWTSGKPISAFGIHATDPLAALYGPESFFNNGAFAPRGSEGRTSSVKNLNVSLQYQREVFQDAELTLKVDVFNVFNWDTPIQIYERSERQSGAPDLRFGLPQVFQTPRYVRLGASIDF